jgi:hypothetical protein
VVAGAISGELIEQLFLPAHTDAAAAALGLRGARHRRRAHRLLKDSFVVRRMFFPGAPSVASPSTAR